MSGTKRKIDHDGFAMPAGKACENNGLASELKSMRCMLNQLLDMSRTLQDEMKSMREELSSMKNTIGEGFDDVENRFKYNEILLRNQKWEYSAPVTHQTHSYLLKQMKKATIQMRRGSCDRTVWISAAEVSHAREISTSTLEGVL